MGDGDTARGEFNRDAGAKALQAKVAKQPDEIEVLAVSRGIDHGGGEVDLSGFAFELAKGAIDGLPAANFKLRPSLWKPGGKNGVKAASVARLRADHLIETS